MNLPEPLPKQFSSLMDDVPSGRLEIPQFQREFVWEIKKFGKNDIHTHIGFYIGNHQAISNSSNKGCPIKHHWTFNNERKITAIYWHPKLSL